MVDPGFPSWVRNDSDVDTKNLFLPSLDTIKEWMETKREQWVKSSAWASNPKFHEAIHSMASLRSAVRSSRLEYSLRQLSLCSGAGVGLAGSSGTLEPGL
jgi:hypothetical protein